MDGAVFYFPNNEHDAGEALAGSEPSCSGNNIFLRRKPLGDGMTAIPTTGKATHPASRTMFSDLRRHITIAFQSFARQLCQSVRGSPLRRADLPASGEPGWTAQDT